VREEGLDQARSLVVLAALDEHALDVGVVRSFPTQRSGFLSVSRGKRMSELTVVDSVLDSSIDPSMLD